MSILAVRMIEQAGENHRPTSATARCSAKSSVKSRALFGQLVEVRSFDRIITVAAGIWALVVRYKQDDIDFVFIAQTRKCEKCHSNPGKPQFNEHSTTYQNE